jgi:hypothetical protein
MPNANTVMLQLTRECRALGACARLQRLHSVTVFGTMSCLKAMAAFLRMGPITSGWKGTFIWAERQGGWAGGL